MFIDTHCHLYLEEFSADRDEVISRAITKDVEFFFLPAIDSKHTASMLRLEDDYPGRCFAMTGLHPCSVKESYKEELKIVEDYLRERNFAAIGESGLDFYWDRTFVKEQYLALEKQIEFALEYDLPLVLHTRNATQEVIDVIQHYVSSGLRGIFHCFGGTAEEAMQIINTGFYLGIGGVVTFKNSGLDKILKEISLDKIVLETDAPYLAPVPYRGKRNESSYLIYITEKIAEIKNIAVAEVANITTANARKIFRI